MFLVSTKDEVCNQAALADIKDWKGSKLSDHSLILIDWHSVRAIPLQHINFFIGKAVCEILSEHIMSFHLK